MTFLLNWDQNKKKKQVELGAVVLKETASTLRNASAYEKEGDAPSNAFAFNAKMKISTFLISPRKKEKYTLLGSTTFWKEHINSLISLSNWNSLSKYRRVLNMKINVLKNLNIGIKTMRTIDQVPSPTTKEKANHVWIACLRGLKSQNLQECSWI